MNHPRAAGRKRGHAEFSESQRPVSGHRATVPCGPTSGAHPDLGGVWSQSRLASPGRVELAESSTAHRLCAEEPTADASVFVARAPGADHLWACRPWYWSQTPAALAA